MRTIFLSVIALALATGAGAAPAGAQALVCPAGYYYASDGQCYPGVPPTYPPPVMRLRRRSNQPPVVIDGIGFGGGYRDAAMELRGHNT